MAEKNHRPRDDGLLANSSLLRSFKKIPELIGSCSKMFEVPRRLSLAQSNDRTDGHISKSPIADHLLLSQRQPTHSNAFPCRKDMRTA